MELYTLAIETSCDDTSISILEGIEVISLKTFSQIKDHKKFGGVIPEIASRLHSKYIFDIIKETIFEAGIKLNDINRIAVTGGPGLVNTLQVGIVVAKTLSLLLNIPIYDINHVEAHAYSPFIGKNAKRIPKRAIVLIVSGGHTEISIKKDWTFKKIGETKDDSIGEAYDKVAKILKLGYPGGPAIDKIYSTIESDGIKCPVSNLENYDFSYSGLKSHVMNKSKDKKNDFKSLAKGFQTSAIQQLVIKVKKAIEEHKIKNVIVGGGVSANSLLREKLLELRDVNLHLPKIMYTGDNAAMIGYLAAIKIESNQLKPSSLKLDAEPRRKI